MTAENKTLEVSSLSDLQAKKHSMKWERMDVMELEFDADLNLRFKKGQKTFGIDIQTDTYDLPTMKLQIIDGVGIQEPLDVSLRSNGKKIVLRGDRRGQAGQELVADPNTPKDVLEALKNVPVRIYKNLTPEQEMELVQDQGQKPFLRSETVKQVWRLQQLGWGFERIAMHLFEVFGKFSGNARKVAEIRAIPENDVVNRRQAIKTWLRGTLDEYVMPAYKLGNRVMRATLLSEMHLDGLPNVEKPEWITTKATQKRMAALEKARKLDGNLWNHHQGGAEFNKVIEGFIKEDYPDPNVINTNATVAKKRLTMAELTARVEGSRSAVAKMAFQIASGETVDEFPTKDEATSLFEAKEGLAMQYLPSVKADANITLAEAIRAFIVSDSITDFESFLAKHSNPLQQNETSEIPAEEIQGGESGVEAA